MINYLILNIIILIDISIYNYNSKNHIINILIDYYLFNILYLIQITILNFKNHIINVEEY